jgi:hypothetical protein
MQNLLEAVPFGYRIIIQPHSVGLVYEENLKWHLAMGKHLKSKRGWRKVLGEFDTRAAAQEKARKLGFGSIMYKSKIQRRWTQISLNRERDWNDIYRRHRV